MYVGRSVRLALLSNVDGSFQNKLLKRSKFLSKHTQLFFVSLVLKMNLKSLILLLLCSFCCLGVYAQTATHFLNIDPVWNVDHISAAPATSSVPTRVLAHHRVGSGVSILSGSIDPALNVDTELHAARVFVTRRPSFGDATPAPPPVQEGNNPIDPNNDSLPPFSSPPENSPVSTRTIALAASFGGFGFVVIVAAIALFIRRTVSPAAFGPDVEVISKELTPPRSICWSTRSASTMFYPAFGGNSIMSPSSFHYSVQLSSPRLPPTSPHISIDMSSLDNHDYKQQEGSHNMGYWLQKFLKQPPKQQQEATTSHSFVSPLDLPPTEFLPLPNCPYALVSRQSILDDPIRRQGVY